MNCDIYDFAGFIYLFAMYHFSVEKSLLFDVTLYQKSVVILRKLCNDRLHVRVQFDNAGANNNTKII